MVDVITEQPLANRPIRTPSESRNQFPVLYEDPKNADEMRRYAYWAYDDYFKALLSPNTEDQKPPLEALKELRDKVYRMKEFEFQDWVVAFPDDRKEIAQWISDAYQLDVEMFVPDRLPPEATDIFQILAAPLEFTMWRRKTVQCCDTFLKTPSHLNEGHVQAKIRHSIKKLKV